MKRTIIAAACVLLAGPALAQSLGEKTGVNSALGVAPATADFVKEVAVSDMVEIESSKLAEEKARDGDVKDFAKQMIADHTKAAEGLKKAAKLGDEPPVLAPKHQAMLDTLKGASGEDFQALYIEMQASAHMDAVTLFATYAKGGDDAAVKQFAAETLPKLEMHKMHVMKLVAAH